MSSKKIVIKTKIKTKIKILIKLFKKKKENIKQLLHNYLTVMKIYHHYINQVELILLF